MSVLIETSAGEFVVDLFVEDCPKACENFLKLCKIKYYNNSLVFQVQRDHILQSGDPTGTGDNGASIYGQLKEKKDRGFFTDEIVPHLRFNKPGLLCMANQGPNTNTSQFFITLRKTDLEYLNEKHTIFGCIAEGLDSTLKDINETELDLKGRPLFDIRILHTHVLDDPFPDPPNLDKLEYNRESHKPEEEVVEERIPYGTDVTDNHGKTEAEIEAERKDKETRARAQVLTILGDLPDADVKPPENVLFVCKLNPVTEDEDLELIFSRFGEIKTCEIIRDPKTGDSLQYAFVEFATEEQCQEAYLKMNNVLIDERRIKVDFSQSVSKLWNKWAIGSSGTKGNMSQRQTLGIGRAVNEQPGPQRNHHGRAKGHFEEIIRDKARSRRRIEERRSREPLGRKREERRSGRTIEERQGRRRRSSSRWRGRNSHSRRERSRRSRSKR